MALGEKKYDVETNNDWAKNVRGGHLFIDNAQSGRNGYYCIGCNKEMEAVIRKKNLEHRSYFRHIPVDNAKNEKPCTFSNREYREKLAIDILQRLKRIKVPSLYKYPPKNIHANPNLLDKAKFINAHTVRSQLTFYEDYDGIVRYGKNLDIKDRYLLIRPDVVFFNTENEPILFIELVVNHKITDEKKIKLRRLGIDTISVIVPRTSEQEIEDNFKITNKVKWEFNGIEADTEYIPIALRSSEGVLEFDEKQRRIFEESYTCRKNRIRNTIRSINKCLGAKSYRQIEHLFKQEISRIEEATEGARQRLYEMERRFEEEVFSDFTRGYEEIERKKREVSEGEKEFFNYKGDLEKRYLKKREDLTRFIEDRHESIKYSGLTEEQIERTQSDIERYNNDLGKLRAEEDKLQIEFGQLEEQEQSYFNRKERNLEKEIRQFGEIIEQNETKLRDEFKGKEDQAIKRVNERDSSGNSELSERIEAVLDLRRLCSSFSDRQATLKRYKSYLELARKGNWKKQ